MEGWAWLSGSETTLNGRETMRNGSQTMLNGSESMLNGNQLAKSLQRPPDASGASVVQPDSVRRSTEWPKRRAPTGSVLQRFRTVNWNGKGYGWGRKKRRRSGSFGDKEEGNPLARGRHARHMD
jgi:hypothetical protein